MLAHLDARWWLWLRLGIWWLEAVVAAVAAVLVLGAYLHSTRRFDTLIGLFCPRGCGVPAPPADAPLPVIWVATFLDASVSSPSPPGYLVSWSYSSSSIAFSMDSLLCVTMASSGA